MNFFRPKQNPPTAVLPPSPPHNPLQEALTSIHTHFSNLFNDWQAKIPPKTPLFARIPTQTYTAHGKPSNSVATSSFSSKGYAMSNEAIEERLAGVPVYALSNGSQEFVLVSGKNTGKNLGLFCLGEADAESLLKQMKLADPSMSSGSQVVTVALSKVFQLKVDGVALRLIPEASQIKNALKERQTAGFSGESFPGVPVFQSKSLILRSGDKRYQPVFFRKEDLERSLLRASRDQRKMNPLLKGDVQVAALEDIIQGMKNNADSSWDDVVFIPPGFDVSTDPSHK